MYTLYPAIKTYAEHKISVASPHKIYVEECGNPDGLPVLVCHSGPGAGCETYHRRFFDPEQYRIILFDQRGAGRSTPHAELTHNTTQDLIDDMETIRDYLGIERWVLFGGAWGSALSLLYAQTYPQNVHGLILHRIFLGQQENIDWFYQHGASRIFPDYWQDFIAPIPTDERDNLIKAYAKRLTGADELARMAAAKSWSLWQARCSSLHPHIHIIDHFSDPHFAIALATIETHYFLNRCFIEDNQILENCNKIRHIPNYIIHGRYDMVCPLQTAWKLHQQCSASELMIVRDAGHSIREPGIIDALVIATKKMAKQESDVC